REKREESSHATAVRAEKSAGNGDRGRRDDLGCWSTGKRVADEEDVATREGVRAGAEDGVLQPNEVLGRRRRQLAALSDDEAAAARAGQDVESQYGAAARRDAARSEAECRGIYAAAVGREQERPRQRHATRHANLRAAKRDDRPGKREGAVIETDEWL